jgi:hypothetical protein
VSGYFTVKIWMLCLIFYHIEIKRYYFIGVFFALVRQHSDDISLLIITFQVYSERSKGISNEI